ncbi:hypothetical protein L0Y97_15430 [Burkholderia multivorans]|uniref:hypothetical protein n=1 Tax=Burkholderia multivorans TaxID=87883 RepID=UPI000CFEF5AA|nr:hypothetical protein [Burkholderia multivorans]MCO1360352.1 hypothetical protein [Burkholderia multivorans]MCO1402960.1 hypothetical protein [Burkholderia multivorans]MCO1420118.1 hypothetical protein [Burkholderia multivorans]PRD91780.1 hypothetical protein C6P76_01345 [Burkholderia multivorans]UQO78518.1 hypothetical protein L0Z12_05660 [Burkholderia multivorans]
MSETNEGLAVEKSGKIAANIQQLVAELARQVREQSHECTVSFTVVIDHAGAHVSQRTVGHEYAQATGGTFINVRGELIGGK